MKQKTWADVVGFEGMSFTVSPKQFDLSDLHPNEDELETNSYFHFRGKKCSSHSKLTKPPDDITPESTLMFLSMLTNMARRHFLTGVYAILMGEDPDEKIHDGEYIEKVEHIMERTDGS